VDVVELPRDARLFRWTSAPVHGILCAPPCTVFSYARNRYEPEADEIREALSVVDACLRIVLAQAPRWWALENPRNKLRRYLGPARLEFYQWEYGDPGHKPTCLWGEFVAPRKAPRPRTKPSTFRTKQENASPRDAITPPGFARAFLRGESMTRGFEHLTAGDVAKLGKQAIAKPSKYKNVKVVVDGITFDSKREAAYWVGLKAREKAGEINCLRRQVVFPLMAPQASSPSFGVQVAFYIADFVFDDADGHRHVVDAKGARTAIYKLKRKWLFLQDGIEIEEV
jgi:hypothetical protein